MKNLSNKLLLSRLEKLGACSDAVTWIGNRDLKTAWEECPRADWLLWLAGKSKKLTRQQLVIAACVCARSSLQWVTAGEERPRLAIEAAEKWTRGEATLEEVRKAAYAAYAAYAADAANAAGAAGAAAEAARAAGAAARAAGAAAEAAGAAYAANAAYAAYAAGAVARAAGDAAQQECINRFREIVSYTDL
jgi:hypothetical protein